jgi:hypothetical protein
MGVGRGRGKAGRCEDEGRNVKVACTMTPPQAVEVAYMKVSWHAVIRWYRQLSCISQSQWLDV